MLKYILENGGIGMKIFLLIISLLLIAIVLLQSNKAESASQIISGGNADLNIMAVYQQKDDKDCTDDSCYDSKDDIPIKDYILKDHLKFFQN